ncbi:MAG: hypothetical protein Q7R52_00145 [archaeon]|nr:hypothetical protein [archaeon]
MEEEKRIEEPKIKRDVIRCINCLKYLAANVSKEEGTFMYCKCGFVMSLQKSRVEHIEVDEVFNDVTHILKSKY